MAVRQVNRTGYTNGQSKFRFQEHDYTTYSVAVILSTSFHGYPEADPPSPVEFVHQTVGPPRVFYYDKR